MNKLIAGIVVVMLLVIGVANVDANVEAKSRIKGHAPQQKHTPPQHKHKKKHKSKKNHNHEHNHGPHANFELGW
ncbi:hypothetical protein LBMAG51_10940 [Phycisphaerae bacterium]|nr:hypothetical protein LBMAG51_10940 [Phycisphaerae bacterium]